MAHVPQPTASLVSSRKASMPAVADERTRILVLGSLPGEASLAAQHYYAHPRNHFWPLMEQLLGADLVALPYRSKLQRLLDHGVGLWDMVASAERHGSLDQQLRDVTTNALLPLVESLPELRALAFNGTKSAQLARRQLSSLDGRVTALFLPSSSPAFTLAFAEKLAAWRSIRHYLTDIT